MGKLETWRIIILLVRYWVKGTFSRVALLSLLIGETFGIVFILFASNTFLSFSTKFGLGAGLSDLALSLILAFALVGMIQNGLNGSGLPVSAADVDYVFTSPLKTREIFAAKVLANSLTTVLFSFPPLLALYLRLSSFYHAAPSTAILAGLVTLLFLLLGLILSADLTLSLSFSIGPRLKLLRNSLVILIVAISLIPITLLIPNAPSGLTALTRILPSGLTAELSVGLISGATYNLTWALDLILLFTWLAALILLGVRMSKAHFYEVLQVEDAPTDKLDKSKVTSQMETAGRSIWTVVRMKEKVLMQRTKERRGLLISALFLAGFMIIYSLAGTFQSSPTSFLFILFIIGSFGSGNAYRWLEKERLWIIKTSTLDVKHYVKEVYRTRVTPLILLLTPVTVAVGIPLLIGQLNQPRTLLSIALALPVALEIAAIMMSGGMYFAARYGQSTSDDILSSQSRELMDIKRFLFQTVINLALVSPLMGLVLVTGLPLLAQIPLVPLAFLLILVSLGYTYGTLNGILNAAGNSISRREDL
jgi:putative ABC exporter